METKKIIEAIANFRILFPEASVDYRMEAKLMAKNFDGPGKCIIIPRKSSLEGVTDLVDDFTAANFELSVGKLINEERPNGCYGVFIPSDNVSDNSFNNQLIISEALILLRQSDYFKNKIIWCSGTRILGEDFYHPYLLLNEGNETLFINSSKKNKFTKEFKVKVVEL